MTKVPEEITNDEFLGRAIFSSKKKINLHVFLEKPGQSSLSMDRFGFCSIKDLTDIQDKNAEQRSKNESQKRSFYGWAKIQARKIRAEDRQLKFTPIEGSNPYHADIILPKNIDRDTEKMHAEELADNSEWTPKAIS